MLQEEAGLRRVVRIYIFFGKFSKRNNRQRQRKFDRDFGKAAACNPHPGRSFRGKGTLYDAWQDSARVSQFSAFSPSECSRILQQRMPSLRHVARGRRCIFNYLRNGGTEVVPRDSASYQEGCKMVSSRPHGRGVAHSTPKISSSSSV